MPAEAQDAPTDERRSETQRHWDIICLTVVSLATAVLGALVVLSGVVEIGQTDNPITDTEITVSIFALLAAGIYFILVLEARKAIFPPSQHQGESGLAWKRSRVMFTVQLFLTLVLLFVAMMFLRVALSVYVPWVIQGTS